jgi:hypothetical protein
VGTDECNRYEVSLDLAQAELKASCHYGTVLQRYQTFKRFSLPLIFLLLS